MSIRVVKRAYKYRFYLSPEQADLLNRTFGSVRYVYNRALAGRSRAWTQEHKRVTFAETCRMLTAWKNDPDTAWLYEVSNVAMQELRRQLEYKADWYGRNVIAVDRFYPSSKTCSACGVITAKMPLSVREWVCTACGVRHDRDVNAAKVLQAAGLAVAACGDGVRPPRTSCTEATVSETGTLAREG